MIVVTVKVSTAVGHALRTTCLCLSAFCQWIESPEPFPVTKLLRATAIKIRGILVKLTTMSDFAKTLYWHNICLSIDVIIRKISILHCKIDVQFTMMKPEAVLIVKGTMIYLSPVNVIAKECKAMGVWQERDSFNRGGGHRLTGNTMSTRASLLLLLHYLWCGRIRIAYTVIPHVCICVCVCVCIRLNGVLMVPTGVIRYYLVAILIARCTLCVHCDFRKKHAYLLIHTNVM